MSTTIAQTMNPNRRRALLETAAREFATAGYERASLNRVIRACGMSKSSFYHFFGSKAALFDTVVREAAEAMAGDLAIPDPEALAGPDFWERVAALGQRLMAMSFRDAWYVDLGKLCYLPDAPAAESPALRHLLEAVAGWVADALAAGQRSDAVRADLPSTLQAELAFAVLQALDRWSVQHLAEIDPAEAENLATLQVDLLRRLLAP
jgi:AcrR family transcriptional regulator